jgi:hypothetical protein
MGIISVGEKLSRSGEQNGKGEVTYSRLFQVITDDPWTGAKAVREAVPIAIGEPYVTSTESDSASVCIGKNASCNSEDGKRWDVTVSYGDNSKVEEQNPLAEPADISWSFAQFTRPVDIDCDSVAILNAASDPYSEPIETDDSRPVLKVTRNEAGFDPALANAYRDATNSDSFMGFSPGCCKVSNISATRTKFANPELGDFYYVTSYEIHFNPDGFDRKILNAGLRELVEVDGEIVKKPILIAGQPVSEPHLLDENGKALEQGGEPVFRTHRLNNRLPFSIFDLS